MVNHYHIIGGPARYNRILLLLEYKVHSPGMQDANETKEKQNMP